MKLTAAVLTISDSSFRGEREDLSGPRLQQCLKDAGFEISITKTLPDEAQQIAAALRIAASQARFVLTTGGTGVSPRDVTPEATRKVCDRLLDGVGELMRAEGLKQTPFAVLSRGVCGTIGVSLVLNLPGNPAGAEQSLKVVLPVIPHALDLLAGKTAH
ncbi:MAG: molybdenum cofactor biosynthesis protein [Acidobacteria bacterium]|nr:MAG: molybdenum cofactor biosynthesis protein [Acidobacteriota bacterium]PYY03266.1 MAG: molybdenum cofactor biosynthesis protein [Acidobacteriota bacterium]PYY23756.1 MAG: molybdenum cofactor biosynthesis protein [Acidobacteriota bacterium]